MSMFLLLERFILIWLAGFLPSTALCYLAEVLGIGLFLASRVSKMSSPFDRLERPPWEIPFLPILNSIRLSKKGIVYAKLQWAKTNMR